MKTIPTLTTGELIELLRQFPSDTVPCVLIGPENYEPFTFWSVEVSNVMERGDSADGVVLTLHRQIGGPDSVNAD